jgi:hypothetical protein
MALKYKIINSKKIVYVIGNGVITFSELIQHIDELAQDPAYTAPMKKLVDYRDIESLNLSMNESEIFAQRKAELDEIFSEEKCAIVTTIDSSFGVARVHDTLIGFKNPNIDTMVFRDFIKAQQWLGIALDDDELTIA